jgi:uncharacterized protein YqiB (DUF1249 family)
LVLSVGAQSSTTPSLPFTFVWGAGVGPARDPELQIRVYHDARLAEACGTSGDPAHPGLRRLAVNVPREHGRRWACNMLLNKWLEYCAGSGHRFASPAS